MKLFKLITKSLLIAALITSCSGNTESDVTPLSKEISGELGDYFEIVDGSYKLVKSTEMFGDWTISVKIKRNGKPYKINYEDIDDQNITSDNNFYLDFLDEKGSPIAGFEKFQATKTFKEIFDTPLNSETNLVFEGDVSEENSESLPKDIRKIRVRSSVTFWDSQSNNNDEDETSSSTEVDLSSMLDDYEEFVDEYIVVFKKSMALSKKMQSGDMSAANEAASISEESISLMEKAKELEDKLEKAKDQMDTDDLKRFIKMQTKLANAAMQAM